MVILLGVANALVLSELLAKQRQRAERCEKALATSDFKSGKFPVCLPPLIIASGVCLVSCQDAPGNRDAAVEQCRRKMDVGSEQLKWSWTESNHGSQMILWKDW